MSTHLKIWNHWLSKFTVSLSFLLSFSISDPVFSQLIPAPHDTQILVTPQGRQFNITGGQASGDGGNLFHSFTEFNLSQGQIANFITTPQIENILSRVTGVIPRAVSFSRPN